MNYFFYDIYAALADNGEIAGVDEETRRLVLEVYAGTRCPVCHNNDIEPNKLLHYYFCITCGEKWTVPHMLSHSALLRPRPSYKKRR